MDDSWLNRGQNDLGWGVEGEQAPAVWRFVHPVIEHQVIEHHRHLLGRPGHLQFGARFTPRPLQLIAKFRRIDPEAVKLRLQGRKQFQAVLGVVGRKAEALSPEIGRAHV